MPSKKDLFSTQQLRELNLIKLLSQDKEAFDYKTICRQLDCSFITLQSELARLSTFPGISSFPYIESHLTIDYHKAYGPQKLYQSVLLDAPTLRLMESFFFNECHNLDTLASNLFISLSTLKRLIKRTNTYLKQTFDCKIDIKQFSIVGNEKQIRLFYLKYFSEAYDKHDWPFDDLVSESALEDLIHLSAKQLDAPIDYSLLHHLKIMAGVHLVRFSQGYRVNDVYPLAQDLCHQLEDESAFTDLHDKFETDFLEPLNCLALSEMFSAFFLEDVMVNFQKIPLADEDNQKVDFHDWSQLMLTIEKGLPLEIANKDEICRHLHNATILGDYDIYENFLIYDYRKPFLDYFKSNYPDLWQSLCDSIEATYDKKGVDMQDKDLNHMLYVLLINWDNLFMQLSNAISKQKLLVIEKGSCNVGQFLQGFAGQFFDITIHQEMDIKKAHIEGKYDLVLTDVSLEQIDGVDVYFFSQLVPSIALAELNKHLKHKIQNRFKLTS
ncbi:transcriptional regulator [Streptococcus iniae]|uniref:helix-turn-helix domain-containing protein n=1 Tax=Streptococcus iniae TaxID=1346 RepID=UPI000EF7014F|nr:helix-turn-helix domain-containing protein [Streptococcus iniae]RLU63102.1 transcriptional regulator [Streptococcus iniae]RLU64568.1 transcriptional regulator [Streptococcus iniae]RLU72780.1 transcriptional regulator [Streptococcus iniae]RLU86781.1 transcriptional regulator [Streptococcus iniae]RLU87034.1 transcriptional regulator [Streptococcus iniae]